MEIDLRKLLAAVQRDPIDDPEDYNKPIYMRAQTIALIMTADCASRQAAAAERQTALLAQMAGALNILIDMMGDALADTPVPLDDGLPFGTPPDYCDGCDRPLNDDDAHIGEQGEKYHPDCCPDCKEKRARIAADGVDPDTVDYTALPTTRPLGIRTAKQVRQ